MILSNSTTVIIYKIIKYKIIKFEKKLFVIYYFLFLNLLGSSGIYSAYLYNSKNVFNSSYDLSFKNF